MGRFPKVVSRMSVAGSVAILAGSMMIVGVAVQALTTSAFADTSPFELFCTNSPIGNLTINDVVMTGSLSTASPSVGQQFSLDNFQAQVNVPPDIIQAAAAVGNTSLTGTASVTIAATGATPSSMTENALGYALTIPNPIPSAGVPLDVPTTAATFGPFTATSSNIALSLGSSIALTFSDVAILGALPPLQCSAYPNDVMPSGFSQVVPPGLPISPVIAVAGEATPPPPVSALTGAYELYCPHTPIGDLIFNDVSTTATISPSDLSAGQQFEVSGYQTEIPLPPGVVSAAVGLGNTSFDGMAASAVDAYGSTPDQVSTGSMSFDVPIPDPVASTPLGLDIPTNSITVGSFTASGGPITIAEDESTFVVAALSSKAFTMSCTAYPNDSVANSGSTGTAPQTTPIRPIIAISSASGTPETTTTTSTLIPPVSPPSPPGTPYELYCPGSPVGNLVLNDTVTTGTITPSTLTEGETFGLSNAQTEFSIPQAVAQQAEDLGLTQLTGDMSVFIDAQGTEDDGYFGGDGTIGVATGTTTATTTATDGGPIIPTYPGSFGELDMAFDVTLPNPVPAAGVQFVATPPPGEIGENDFVAAGGPIEISINTVNLNATEFGDSFGLFCSTYPNDTEPTGLSTAQPDVAPVEPEIATGDASVPPPVVGSQGSYELSCPNTPVGDLTANDVTTTAVLSPANPAAGSQFNVTGFQVSLDVPASLASDAVALGGSDFTGTATMTVDASGATPPSISTGPMSFDVQIPSSVPPSGLSVTVPSAPTTIGPFTASGGGIVITQDSTVQIAIEISNESFDINCATYPNNSAPTGIGFGPPAVSAVDPIIALGDGATAPPPPPTGTAGAYELYCPGTPVGNIVLNDVTTTASISPADPVAGDEFDVTGYQVSVTVPVGIVSAAAALGNTALTGTATATIDATGATPASLPTGTMSFDVPIPIPVPPPGVTLELPSSPSTIGPFTATGDAITISQESMAQLTLSISGNDLDLNCETYPNDSNPTGISQGGPFGVPESPVIATAQIATSPPPPVTTPPATDPVAPISSASTTSVPTTAAPTTSVPATSTPTTVAPSTVGGVTSSTAAPKTDPSASVAPAVSASSRSLAFTGVGPGTWWIVVLGAVLILLGLAMLVAVDAPSRFRWALVHRGVFGRSVPARRRFDSVTSTSNERVVWADDTSWPRLDR